MEFVLQPGNLLRESVCTIDCVIVTVEIVEIVCLVPQLFAPINRFAKVPSIHVVAFPTSLRPPPTFTPSITQTKEAYNLKLK